MADAPLTTMLLFPLLLLLLSIALLISRKRRLSLPPGPRGLPFLGTILQLRALRDRDGAQKLVAQYGPIVTLRFASSIVILVCDGGLIHEALVERGGLFASRPDPAASARDSRMLLSNGGRMINPSPYGPHWRALRRNLAGGTLAASKLHLFAHARRASVDRLLSDLRCLPADPPPAALRKHLRFAVFSILWFMCFGWRLEVDDDVWELESLMREDMKVSAGLPTSLLSLIARGMGIPVFWKTQVDRRVTDYISRRKRFLAPAIEQARKMEQSGQLHPNCYIKTLLQEQQQREQQQQQLELSDEDVLVLVVEFLNAGADTTAVTLEWALALLVKHPQVQDKLFQEIAAAAAAAPIDETKAQELRYLQAVVKETLRTHPPGFATLPHTVTEPCKLGGYDIPTNAAVFFHTFSMANDPDVWELPEVFSPERFMKMSSDAPPLKSYAPFGAGRRICPGLALAELHLHYILARLVQEFEWRAREGEHIDLTGMFEFTILLKTPLDPVILPRHAC